MEVLIACPDCGAKNRVSSAPSGKVPVCGKCHAKLPWLVQVSDATFDGEVDAGVLVVADFWAPWCGPCRVISPILEDLARQHRGSLKIVKLNVDDNPRVAQRFRIQSIPTLVFFKDGQPVDTVVGALPRPALAQKVAALL